MNIEKESKNKQVKCEECGFQKDFEDFLDDLFSCGEPVMHGENYIECECGLDLCIYVELTAKCLNGVKL